jgi:hypothetical protein
MSLVERQPLRAGGVGARRLAEIGSRVPAAAAVVLVPWAGWLATSLPRRYVSRHWALAWTGYDSALAVTLALTCIAAIRRAPWLDRAAVAAATLLAADAWFDVITSSGAAAVALATTEAVAVELPVALLCLWLVPALRLQCAAGAPPASTTSPTTREGAFG